ncbi:hypothetical protein DYI23_14645 [Roseibium polysiphoniae]|uniref:DUF937 domain-containing protein n=1 Tax=Roseibium polysiphoniae TaxID=2571221 RepID=A0A944CDJ5_9HYPH|nr:hypothetical protein [Roseibium polysiphoniae]MBS8261461.1 hypothetical protein [Roseibium polysiphoniae]
MTDVPGFPFPFDLTAVAEDMKRRFGWNEGDLETAMAQLMPAAMSGVRHFGPSVPSFNGLLPQSNALFPMASFFNPQSPPSVDEHLQPFFGPEFVRKAVAEQIASITGLQQEAIAEMMPVAATLAMGQVARPYMQGEARELLDAFLRGYARGRPKPAPTPTDYIQGYTQAMQSFWSGFLKPTTDAAPEPEPEPELQPDTHDEPEGLDDREDVPDPAEEAPSEFDERFAEWVTAGRDMQSSQFKAFDSFFERAVRDMNEVKSKTS